MARYTSDGDSNSSVLLVTIWDNANFGNRLQAIAMKRMLEDCGCAVDCLASNRLSVKARVKRWILEMLGAFCVPRYKALALDRSRRNAIKESCAHIFNSISGEAYGYIAPRIDYSKYDAVITGSDQVWHRWTSWPNELPFFYLEFIELTKRIAYGASFGYDELPPADIDTHVLGLKGIPNISCRERTGCEIVKRLTGQEAALVADPTLCVGRSYWEELEVRPSWVSAARYQLLFCLGSSDAARREAISASRDEGISMIDLRDYSLPEVWDIGIGEFIWLIHHAEHVYTDSFHCTVFSILFGRQFTVFRRDQQGFMCMWDRIATLLEITGLQDRVYNENRANELDDQTMRFAIDRINQEAKRSRDWLALAIEEARRA